jgi:AAA ATPase domain
MNRLPTVYAYPLKAYDDEDNKIVKVLRLCEFVEISLRFAVIVALAELDRPPRAIMPPATLKKLHEWLPKPMLGQWARLSADLSECVRSRGAVVGELYDFTEAVRGVLNEEVGNDCAPSLLALRNALAHAGVREVIAATCLDALEPRVERLRERIGWAEQVHLAGVFDNKRGVLQGPWGEVVEPQSSLGTWPRDCPDGALWLVHDETWLRLWPFARYIAPEGPEAGARNGGTQMYWRWERHEVLYSLLGGDALSGVGTVEESRKFLEIRDRFAPTNELDPVPTSMRDDVSRFVGRKTELGSIREALDKSKHDVLVVLGAPGTGKSTLAAKLVTDLIDLQRFGAGEGESLARLAQPTTVVPYSFKAARDGCSRHAFVSHALAVLEPKRRHRFETGSPLERLSSAVARQHVRAILFVLDGMDEIDRVDPAFVENLRTEIRRIRANRAEGGLLVRWLLFGRKEASLIDAFDESENPTDASPRWVFGKKGLPRMSSKDIRLMIFDGIGPHQARLVRGDKEQANEIVNDFVRKVEQHADGLPIYVRYVIGDVLAGGLDPSTSVPNLPERLEQYHARLLSSHAVGDVAFAKPAVIATLAVAEEPLTEGMVLDLLIHRTVLLPENGLQVLRAALRGLRPVLSIEASSVKGCHGELVYALFHESLREFICAEGSRAAMNGSVELARRSLDWVFETWPNLGMELRRYGSRNIARRLLDRGEGRRLALLLRGNQDDHELRDGTMRAFQNLIARSSPATTNQTVVEFIFELSRRPSGRDADLLVDMLDFARMELGAWVQERLAEPLREVLSAASPTKRFVGAVRVADALNSMGRANEARELLEPLFALARSELNRAISSAPFAMTSWAWHCSPAEAVSVCEEALSTVRRWPHADDGGTGLWEAYVNLSHQRCYAYELEGALRAASEAVDSLPSEMCSFRVPAAHYHRAQRLMRLGRLNDACIALESASNAAVFGGRLTLCYIRAYWAELLGYTRYPECVERAVMDLSELRKEIALGHGSVGLKFACSLLCIGLDAEMEMDSRIVECAQWIERELSERPDTPFWYRRLWAMQLLYRFECRHKQTGAARWLDRTEEVPRFGDAGGRSARPDGYEIATLQYRAEHALAEGELRQALKLAVDAYDLARKRKARLQVPGIARVLEAVAEERSEKERWAAEKRLLTKDEATQILRTWEGLRSPPKRAKRWLCLPAGLARG